MRILIERCATYYNRKPEMFFNLLHEIEKKERGKRERERERKRERERERERSELR